MPPTEYDNVTSWISIWCTFEHSAWALFVFLLSSLYYLRDLDTPRRVTSQWWRWLFLTRQRRPHVKRRASDVNVGVRHCVGRDDKTSLPPAKRPRAANDTHSTGVNRRSSNEPGSQLTTWSSVVSYADGQYWNDKSRGCRYCCSSKV